MKMSRSLNFLISLGLRWEILRFDDPDLMIWYTDHIPNRQLVICLFLHDDKVYHLYGRGCAKGNKCMRILQIGKLYQDQDMHIMHKVLRAHARSAVCPLKIILSVYFNDIISSIFNECQKKSKRRSKSKVQAFHSCEIKIPGNANFLWCSEMEISFHVLAVNLRRCCWNKFYFQKVLLRIRRLAFFKFLIIDIRTSNEAKGVRRSDI